MNYSTKVKKSNGKLILNVTLVNEKNQVVKTLCKNKIFTDSTKCFEYAYDLTN